MKLVVFNLGCKVNQYECDALAAKFAERGFEVSEKLEYAEYYILNTCAVTSEAERKSRQAVARIKKQNPDAKIIVVGCASQKDSSQFEKDGVIYIGGTAGKTALEDLGVSGVNVTKIPCEYEEDGFARSLRTRSYIKIQDGCNNFCTYCIIPHVRGRSRSRAAESVVAEVMETQAECKEIVLTGINLSAYGRDIGLTLTDLLKKLSNADVRIRLSSLEVNIIDDELLFAASKLKKFCPHFHLSLQSGDDTVLKAMNRKYSTGLFLEKAELIRRYFPQAAITTDVIVGFPAESDECFENTLEFVQKVKFANIHIFQYSPREGTPAAKMRQVPKPTVAARAKRLEIVREQMKRAYEQSFIGRPLEVLFEDDGGGYSQNYIKVYADGTSDGELRIVTPQGFFKDGLK